MNIGKNVKQKGIAPIVIILIIVGVLILGGGIYIARQRFFMKKETQLLLPTVMPTVIPEATPSVTITPPAMPTATLTPVSSPISTSSPSSAAPIVSLPSSLPTPTAASGLSSTRTPTPAPTLVSTPGATLGPAGPYQIAVLNLTYIPLKDGKVDTFQTGDWQNSDPEALRKNLRELAEQLIDALNKGSIYRGYDNPNAAPSLSYGIFESKETLESVPMLGQSRPAPADHRKIMEELNICDYVESKGVKEVWLWMYHTARIYPVESYFTGPSASFGNGYMDLSKCEKSYTVYDFNSGRSVAMALENHLHHIEHVLNYIDDRDATAQADWGKLLFWGKFVGSDFSHKIIVPGCGWTHYPPNAESDYDWANEREVMSDCEDWKPDGMGQKKLISCHTWAGTTCSSDEGFSFKVWWMQNIPGKDNNLTYNGKKLRNWWDFIGDLDGAIKLGKSLTI